MSSNDKVNSTNLKDYLTVVYKTILFPSIAFKLLNLNTYQLISYLILSAWIYAVLANILKTYSAFTFLIMAPITVVPHTLLIALTLYLIFGKLNGAKTSFKDCFEVASYMLIALLPIMSISCLPFKKNLLIFIIKSLPFILYVMIQYRATCIKFKALPAGKIISGNVLSSLIIFLISTLIFSMNMAILLFICENIYHFDYVWSFHYE